MTTKTVDLGKIKTSLDLHNILAAELNFPTYYGKNWDAFWEVITGTIELPKILKFTNCDHLRQTLPKDWEMFLKCFTDLKNEYSNIKCDLIFILDNDSKNIFDIILEIFNWIKIFASPLLIGTFVSLIVWFNIDNVFGQCLSIIFFFLGIGVGVYFAEHVRRRGGTREFMARVYRSPDLDNLDNKKS